jgi:ABC-2 type transport system ATP-binding protein
MIRIEGLGKTYRGGLRNRPVRALHDLNLEVQRGEVFGFLGPNGAGKSTTIKALVNLITPDCGKALIGGNNVALRETRCLIGYLPENPYFYDYLSAEELLWFGARVSGLSEKETALRIPQLLQRVDLLAASKRPLRTYSKGMVQRAGLAYALIHAPEVVILDEPMSGLDPLGRKLVVDLILELKAAGKTVFFSSHILNDAERLCDRVGIIVSGRLRTCGAIDDLVQGHDSLESLFMQLAAKYGSDEESHS